MGKERVLMGFVGQKLENAAWYYKEPLEGALDLKDHVAFCEYIPL